VAGSEETPPWATPDQTYVPSAPPPPPQPVAPQHVPATAYTPYAAAYNAPAPPPPAWATPAPLPAGGAGYGLDPWRVRGWRGGGSRAFRVLAAVTGCALLVVMTLVASVAEERAYRKDERLHYLDATGVVRVGDDGTPRFVGAVPGYGVVTVPLDGAADDEDVYEGSTLHLLVAPGDPGDYILPSERAAPGEVLGALVVALVVTAGLATVAYVTFRRRRGDAAAVRHVAVHVSAGEPPPPLDGTLRARPAGVAVRLGIAALLVATAVPAALVAARGIHSVTATVTTPGSVVMGSDDAGHQTVSVRFYDRRTESENTRPLTPAERARGASVGDTIDVTYVAPDADDAGHGNEVMLFWWAGVATLAALLLVRRALLWPRRLRAAQRLAAHPVEVTAWVRVVRKRAWLVVRPPGATRPDQTVAIPVSDERGLPAAIDGRVHLHGSLKPGRVGILRAPNGAVLAPRGPVRAGWLAELTFVGVVPPDQPAPYAGWGYAPSW
jgi:hypothetical protein